MNFLAVLWTVLACVTMGDAIPLFTVRFLALECCVGSELKCFFETTTSTQAPPATTGTPTSSSDAGTTTCITWWFPGETGSSTILDDGTQTGPVPTLTGF